jgi:hypothetical protein
MAQPTWYFEEFEVGKTIAVGSRTETEEEVIAFASQFDPPPYSMSIQPLPNGQCMAASLPAARLACLQFDVADDGRRFF